MSCVSLAGSTSCPAFSSASISVDASLIGLYPFLASVSDRPSFDTQLTQYASHGYVQLKYQTLFNCSNVDLGNTTDLYARYTISFLCNGVVQNSIAPCRLTTAQSQPLCADSCAEFALSEQEIVSSDLCGDTGNAGNVDKQLRADFTDCALPARSIQQNSCIPGYVNEPANCGYESNLSGLCSFCAASSLNSTDSCCVTSKSESLCKNVHLPAYSSVSPLFSTAATATSTSTSLPSSNSHSGPSGGLDGGQIAGIVIGSVIGVALLLGLLICCCMAVARKKRRDEATDSLNRPTPPRSADRMIQTGQSTGFQPLAGARVTRMTALEGPEISSPNDRSGDSDHYGSSPENILTTLPKRKHGRELDGTLPESPTDREESSEDHTSPESNGRSARLESFKDYYSEEEMRAGDIVSVLWAYQPRAADEMEIDRGDMIKIVAIWDDGWATGIKIAQRAEDYEPNGRSGRDSVLSNDGEGEVAKAFPIVCVCLPHHWRKAIWGGESAEYSSEDQPATE